MPSLTTIHPIASHAGPAALGTLPLGLGSSRNAPVMFHEMIPWLVVSVVLAVIGTVVIVYLRRKLFADDESAQPTGMMSELRAMRDRGEISEDEYERTRAVMVAKATGKDPETVRLDAIRKSGGKVAQPGFDLTGQPLPKPRDPSEDKPG